MDIEKKEPTNEDIKKELDKLQDLIRTEIITMKKDISNLRKTIINLHVDDFIGMLNKISNNINNTNEAE